MLPNVESNTLASFSDAIADSESPKTYKDRLKRWAIARMMEEKQLTIVDRFRSRSDADGHLRVFQQRYPTATFVVIADHQDYNAAPLN
jgi:hypothetical protein